MEMDKILWTDILDQMLAEVRALGTGSGVQFSRGHSHGAHPSTEKWTVYVDAYPADLTPKSDAAKPSWPGSTSLTFSHGDDLGRSAFQEKVYGCLDTLADKLLPHSGRDAKEALSLVQEFRGRLQQAWGLTPGADNGTIE